MSEKDRIRARLLADMDKFFSGGGEIIPCTAADNRDANLRGKASKTDGRTSFINDKTKPGDFKLRGPKL